MRLFLPLLLALAAPAADLYVSTRGDDAARRAVRQARQKSHCPITVHFRAGTYYLPATVGFTPEDSGTAATPIAYIAEPGETVVLSGGTRLRIEWRPYRDGILQAHVPPGLTTDQLFVNGQRQPMARYPNRDPHARYFEGWAAGAANKARAARWANPQGGFLHAMHCHMWGGFHFQITGKDPSGELTMIAGTPDSNLPLLDPVKKTVLRNNRWRCDHGWDIDLDDGSSNYEIVNDLCLRGGLKLREGFYRRVENNITAGNTFHPHVWYLGSGDVFRRNIVFAPYRPIRVPVPWGALVDENLLRQPGLGTPQPARILQSQSGRDTNSLLSDALFVDPNKGDIRLQPDSPALNLGFVNSPMDQFGVRKPSLRAIARTAPIATAADPPAETLHFGRDLTPWNWLGAPVRNVAGRGEVSAAGLPAETGVLLREVPAQSEAFRLGLRPHDIVLRLQGQKVDSLNDLKRISGAADSGLDATVRRGQADITLRSRP